MPRTARAQSRTNIYHVMLRGINRQVIFEDNGDRHYFMNVLRNAKELSGFRLYAFCLMSNHVHFLIEPADEPLEVIFKRIGSRYVVWYNRKYQRIGHLFQDRFKSEAVESEEYFRTVLRYILQNPMKAGMESRPGSYRWSSYRAYEKGGGSITDTRFAEDLFGGRDTLMDYLQQGNDDSAMDDTELDWRLRNEWAKEVMSRITHCASVSEFQSLEPALQKEYVREMFLNRLSMNQISRLTGKSKSTVSRTVTGLSPMQFREEQPVVFHEEDPADFGSDGEEIW